MGGYLGKELQILRIKTINLRRHNLEKFKKVQENGTKGTNEGEKSRGGAATQGKKKTNTRKLDWM